MEPRGPTFHCVVFALTTGSGIYSRRRLRFSRFFTRVFLYCLAFSPVWLVLFCRRTITRYTSSSEGLFTYLYVLYDTLSKHETHNPKHEPPTGHYRYLRCPLRPRETGFEDSFAVIVATVVLSRRPPWNFHHGNSLTIGATIAFAASGIQRLRLSPYSQGHPAHGLFSFKEHEPRNCTAAGLRSLSAPCDTIVGAATIGDNIVQYTMRP